MYSNVFSKRVPFYFHISVAVMLPYCRQIYCCGYENHHTDITLNIQESFH